MKKQTLVVLGMSILVIGLGLFACRKQTPNSNDTHVPTASTTIGLTTAECKQLGGTVEEDKICGGQNKKCTTVTFNPATNSSVTHSLCISEQ